MGILFACAVFTSSVASVVGIRQAASFGVLLACAGLVASSFVTVLEYYFITYSLLVGLGTSFIFTAHMTILMHYFKRNIGMANGIAVLGGSVFSVFQPFIVGFCIRNSGLSTTLQVQAGLMSSVLLCAFMWKEQMPRNTYANGEKRTICNVLAEKCPCANRSIINNRNYILFCIAVALAEFTQFVPFVHMVSINIFKRYSLDNCIVTLTCYSMFWRFFKMLIYAEQSSLFFFQFQRRTEKCLRCFQYNYSGITCQSSKENNKKTKVASVYQNVIPNYHI